MPDPINLEKQIKRHVIAQPHDFFAITHPGFEDLCREELRRLGEIEITSVVKGGVAFRSRLSGVYSAALHLRTAGRILMRLTHFKASNFRRLANQSATIVWAHYLPWGDLPTFHVSTRRSRLMHTQAVARSIRTVISAYWQRMGAPLNVDSDQKIWVRVEDDVVEISLDAVGNPLYQRGLKTHPGRAPIRETLAAAILMRAGFQAGQVLVDPMCGTGTFTIEAALMEKQIPPGWYRTFAFMEWPAFRARQWEYLKIQNAPKTGASMDRPTLFASDIEEQACRRLSRCLSENELHDVARIACGDFFNLDPAYMPFAGAPGLVVLNPPYGRRLMADGDISGFYAAIGRKLRLDFDGWRLALLAPEQVPAALLPAGLHRRAVRHGGQEVSLLTGTIG